MGETPDSPYGCELSEEEALANRIADLRTEVALTKVAVLDLIEALYALAAQRGVRLPVLDAALATARSA